MLAGGLLTSVLVLSTGAWSAGRAATAELLVDGRPARAIAWADLADAMVAVRVSGASTSGALPAATIGCTDPDSGDRGEARLAIIDRANGTLRVDLGAAMPAMPYPIDPLRIESKPAAIISQQARRSVALVPPDELRRRFRDTAAYMLQTAHHHYRMPYGDGALSCAVEVHGDPGSPVRTADLEISFGRGLPVGPYDRASSAVPAEHWPAWVVDARDLPGELGAAAVAALRWRAAVAATLAPATAEARRRTDDGGAPGPWITLTLGLIGTRGTNPPRAARALAVVGVAMSEALRARRTIIEAQNLPDTMLGEHTVTAGAAATALRALFPDDMALIDAAETDVLAAWPEDDPARDGALLRLGQWAGAQVVGRADADGSSAIWDGMIAADPARWRSETAGGAPPLEPLAGTWHPWNLMAGDSLRPPAPARPGDAVFEAELREVRGVGVAADLASQQLASYWEDKYGSFTPPGHWTAIALHQVRADGWSSDQAAVLFALLSTAQADAFIAAWDAKYAYWSVRPVTAIRDTLDPAWSPYIPTPDFPSYVSGHATTSGAAATVLSALMPDRATEFQACAEEAAASRLIGGIHFREDNETGLALGRAVGGLAVARTDLSAIVAGLPSGLEPIGCRWTAAAA